VVPSSLAVNPRGWRVPRWWSFEQVPSRQRLDAPVGREGVELPSVHPHHRGCGAAGAWRVRRGVVPSRCYWTGLRSVIADVRDSVTYLLADKGSAGALTSWQPYFLRRRPRSGGAGPERLPSRPPLASLPAIDAGEPAAAILTGIVAFGEHIPPTPSALGIELLGLAAVRGWDRGARSERHRCGRAAQGPGVRRDPSSPGLSVRRRRERSHR
jgi:hypothetical protein